MDHGKLKQELMRDEGVRLHPYKDSVGKLTIGVGRNLDDVGLSPEEVNFLLDHDIDRAVSLARSFCIPRDFDALTDTRQRVLVNMAFNLGGKLWGFKNFREALRVHDYVRAAREMLDSKWAVQVGVRASRLADMMAKGE